MHDVKLETSSPDKRRTSLWEPGGSNRLLTSRFCRVVGHHPTFKTNQTCWRPQPTCARFLLVARLIASILGSGVTFKFYVLRLNVKGTLQECSRSDVIDVVCTKLCQKSNGFSLRVHSLYVKMHEAASSRGWTSWCLHSPRLVWLLLLYVWMFSEIACTFLSSRGGKEQRAGCFFVSRPIGRSGKLKPY